MRNGPRTAELQLDTIYMEDPFPEPQESVRDTFAYTNTAYDMSHDVPRMYPNTSDEYYSPQRYHEEHGSFKNDQSRRPSALPNSAWWKWSQDRRAALARREAAQNDRAKNAVRVPTPIIKAREESMKFVAPELKHQHLPEDHKRNPPKKKVREKKGKKGKKGKKERFVDSEKDLTLEQWNELIEYWDHHAFVWARFLGLGVSVVAIVISIFIIVNDPWVTYVSMTGQQQYAGLWRRCLTNGVSCNSTLEYAHSEKPYHQAVFALMVSTSVVGFFAFIMLIFGLCITYLPQKIYYYHSAGEIFIVTAFLHLCGLVTYPIGITQSNTDMKTVTFAYSYFLGWVSFVLFCLTSLCLLLDELLRESSRPRTFFFSTWFRSKKKSPTLSA